MPFNSRSSNGIETFAKDRQPNAEIFPIFVSGLALSTTIIFRHASRDGKIPRQRRSHR
jgi:hypothetical protein